MLAEIVINPTQAFFWLSVVFSFFAMIFTILQFVSMLSSKISASEKGLWAIAFFLGTFLTAIVWTIANPGKSKKKKRKKKRKKK